jgi:hypothetical protein
MTDNTNTGSDSLFSEIAKKIKEDNEKSNEESLEEKMEKRNKEMFGNLQMDDVRNEVQEGQVLEIRNIRGEKFKNKRLQRIQTIDLTQKLIDKISIDKEFFVNCNNMNVRVKKR